MIKVIQRNSLDSTCVQDLAQLKLDLGASGHNSRTMDELEPKAVERVIGNELYDNNTPKEEENQIVFSVQYFHEVEQLKKLVRSCEPDIIHLCGDIKITFALRKAPSISNRVVKNRNLSVINATTPVTQSTPDQRCKSPKCMTCPYLFESGERIVINGNELRLDQSLSCKSNNIIYVAQCRLCTENGTYFGQTLNAMHIRMNGHRSKFQIDSTLKFEQSALSMHAYLKHKDDFNMNIFKLGIVKQVNPNSLNRLEDYFEENGGGI